MIFFKILHPYVILFIFIAALKLFILMYWGVGVAPDSGGYIRFGSQLLQGDFWTIDADIEKYAMPVTVFRMIGYPFLISIAKSFSVENWKLFIVLSQMIVSIISLLCVFRLARSLFLSPFFIVFCVFSAATSMSLILDQMILTDSLVASFFVIILCEVTIGSLRGDPFGVLEAFFYGLLLSIAFFLREGVLVLSCLLIFPLCVRVLLSKCNKVTSFFSVFLFFIPILIAAQLITCWNERRTDFEFVTTGGQTVYLQGLMDAAAYDGRIFSGSEPLDQIAREQFDQYVFSEVLAIQSEMFKEGYTAPEIAIIAKGKYFESWVDYPFTMLSSTIRHFRGRFPSLNFRPIASLRETGLWITHEYPWSSYGDLRTQAFTEIGAFILFAAESLERVIGITIWVFFVLAPLVWLARLMLGKKQSKEKALTCAALWTVYMGLMAAHLLVHIESRYFAPVIPFSILIGLLGIQKLLSRYFPKKISAHA